MYGSRSRAPAFKHKALNSNPSLTFKKKNYKWDNLEK
jgi:hypothetical protein